MAKIRNEVEIGHVPRSLHRSVGRKLEYEMIDELVEYTKQSMYVETACKAVGITELTVQDWMKLGKDMLERLETGQLRESDLTEHRAKCVDLYIELSRVLAMNEIQDVKWLNHLCELRDFRAIKFKLERTSPERWGKKDHLTIEAGSGQRVAKEPRVVDYGAEIAEADEFKMLEEEYNNPDIEDVEIIYEERPTHE